MKALRFELAHVQVEYLRTRTLLQLAQVDHDLASRVAEGLGLAIPSAEGQQLNLQVPADVNPADYQSVPAKANVGSSPALSLAADSPINQGKGSVKNPSDCHSGYRWADVAGIAELMKAFMEQGAQTAIVATHLGTLKGSDGEEILINWTFQSTSSALFDAVYVAAGAQSVTKLKQDSDAVRFVNEAFRHCKPLAASAEGVELLKAAAYPGAEDILEAEGVVTSASTDVAELVQEFAQAIKQHRFWSRELEAVPA